MTSDERGHLITVRLDRFLDLVNDEYEADRARKRAQEQSSKDCEARRAIMAEVEELRKAVSKWRDLYDVAQKAASKWRDLYDVAQLEIMALRHRLWRQGPLDDGRIVIEGDSDENNDSTDGSLG